MGFFRKTPVADLINKHIDKAAKWPAQGKFLLVLRVPAKRLSDWNTMMKLAESSKQLAAPLFSVLLISERALDAKEIALAEKDNESVEQSISVKGEFTSDKAGTKSFHFIYDADSAEDAAKIYNDNLLYVYLRLALWAYMPADCKKVYWYGSSSSLKKKMEDFEVDKPELAEETRELTDWDITKLIRTVASASPEDGGLGKAPPRPTVSMTPEDTWPFDNLKLPSGGIRPQLTGPVSALVLTDPTLLQFLYDAGWEVAKSHTISLIADLSEADALAGAEDPESVRKADELVKKALKKFEKELLAACAVKVNEAWTTYAGANKQYLKYQIKMGLKIALQAAGVAAAVAGTVLSAVTVIGVVWGTWGACKSVVALSRDCYYATVTSEGLAYKIQKDLKAFAEAIANEKDRVVRVENEQIVKEVLRTLTGYSGLSFSRLGKDAETLLNKCVKGLVDVKKLSKDLNSVIDKLDKASKELEMGLNLHLAKTAKSSEKYGWKVKLPAKLAMTAELPGTLEGIITALGKVRPARSPEKHLMCIWTWRMLQFTYGEHTQMELGLDATLNKISDMMESLNNQKKIAGEAQKFLADADQKMGKVRNGFLNYVVPVLDLAFLEPQKWAEVSTWEQILDIVKPSVRVVADMLNNLLQSKAKKEWAKLRAEQANNGLSNASDVHDIVATLDEILQ